MAFFCKMTWSEILAQISQQCGQWYTESEQQVVAKQLVEHLSGQSLLSWKLSANPSIEAEALEPFIAALASGRPLQYVLGYAYFSGMRLMVNDAVLIPRPETDELVEWIIEITKTISKPQRVIDIGTGSGCIALGLKRKQQVWHVVGVDISEAALAVAGENARAQGLAMEFKHHDILSSDWPFTEQFSLWVSNPPYILPEEQHEMSEQVLKHEPHTALFVTNNDPLQFYKAIEAKWLQFGTAEAFLFFELSTEAQQIITYFQAKPTYSVWEKNDMYGKPRMLCVQRKRP